MKEENLPVTNKKISHSSIQRIHYPEVDSTNRVLKALALAGASPGTMVSADQQTAGRGRLGRNFFSPNHTGLYLSILYGEKDWSGNPLTLTVYAAVAAAQAIKEALGIEVGIKWVNDLYYQQKKCAGLLAEGLIQNGQLHAIILGIGMNLWDPPQGFPEELRPMAGSLLGPGKPNETCKEKLMNTLIDHLYPLAQNPKQMEVYRQQSLVIGKKVHLTGTGSDTITGLVKDIDNQGALILKTDRGDRRITSGEITIRPLSHW